MHNAQPASRVNVGCGATPTRGWVNLDNSPTVRLAHMPLVNALVASIPPLKRRTQFLRVARQTGIKWASATSLPLADASMEVVYSSHMLEHLDTAKAEEFLREARRVLRPKGVLRIVVPDLSKLVEQYVRSGDADWFLEATLLTLPPAKSALDRLKLGALGHRGHAWMYDAASLKRLIERCGFADVQAVPPGETRIAEPGPLDLHERADESIFIEGTRP